jgi:alkylhydroperoxidase family enzyme
MSNEPRIRPLPTSEWPPEMRGAMAAIQPPVLRHPLPVRVPGRPKGLNALGLLAQHPELTTAYHALAGHVLFATSLSVRQRELVVLRVASRRDSEYEWSQHVVQGLDAGLNRDEIAAAAEPAIGGAWSPLDAAILAAVDELVDDARMGDETWAALSAEFDVKQIMDLIFTVGSYDVLAMLFRSADVRLDDDLTAWMTRYDAGEDQP